MIAPKRIKATKIVAKKRSGVAAIKDFAVENRNTLCTPHCKDHSGIAEVSANMVDKQFANT